MKDFWTEERIKRLKQMRDEGYSASQIAEKIGAASRDAVLGKMFRLGMCSPMPVKLAKSAELYRARQARMNVKRREKRHEVKPYLVQLYESRERRAREAKMLAEEKTRARAIIAARGATKTSAAYRTHMPRIGDMSKSQLRAMITQAVQNTAALS